MKTLGLNWKMQGSWAAVTAFAAAQNWEASSPLIWFLPTVYTAIRSRYPHMRLGAQSLSRWKGQGAHTGEISGELLKDAGYTYVLIGHAERAALGEHQPTVLMQQFENALHAGLIPVLCVGNQDPTLGIAQLFQQLNALKPVLQDTKGQSWCLAYEPKWAIGANIALDTEQLSQDYLALQGWFSEHFSHDIMPSWWYGGSVNAENFANLCQDIPILNGVLLGRAALDAQQVHSMLKILQEIETP